MQLCPYQMGFLLGSGDLARCSLGGRSAGKKKETNATQDWNGSEVFSSPEVSIAKLFASITLHPT